MSQDYEELTRQIGRRVVSLRKTLGMNQAQLAALAGVHQTYISRIERGQGARISTLVSVADALKVSLDYLVSAKGADEQSHEAAFRHGYELARARVLAALVGDADE